MGNEVASEIAAWNARAGVAREVAGELKQLSSELNNVLQANYFGEGCEEGAALYGRLQMLLSGGRSSLAEQSTAAIGLGNAAETAGQSLTQTDADNSETLARK